MILRQFIRMLMIAAVVAIGFASFAHAGKIVDTKFQKDLESLLGAPLKTKHGQMSLRQTKDRRGKVRKQILVGPGFSEVQLDQNGDGTVDYWSITQGRKTVTVSEPNRGRFLRLVVSDRDPKGMVESTYLLSLNGRKYNLLKSRFVGNGVRYAADSADVKTSEFEPADDAESERVQRILDSGGGDASSIDAAAIPAVKDDRFSLVEADWTQEQTVVFGDQILCSASDNGPGRLAALQREWWKVLKFEVDDKVDRLATKLKASAMFADSCKTPENSKEFNRMTAALSQVMLSSAKGEAWTSETSRGRYLRCLENSGLGMTAAEMERGFLDSMSATYRSYAPITCDIKPGAEGIAKPGEAFPARQQIVLYMSAADEGKAKEAQGSTQNYQNVIFHELIHIAGISDEGIVHAAQACCGDPTADRGVACNQLDSLVAKAARSKELETFLSRSSSQLTPLQGQLESTFGPDDANKIYKSFLEGLDNYKRGSPSEGSYAKGLISGEEFDKCVATQNPTVCKAQWTSEIRAYADSFFSKTCRTVASGANRKSCGKMSAEFKDSMTNAIVSSMVGEPCVPVSKSTAQLEANSSSTIAKILVSVFGTSAIASDSAGFCEADCDVPSARIPVAVVCSPECPAQPTVVPVDIKNDPSGKTISVPGSADIGTGGGISGRPTNSVGSGSSGGGGYASGGSNGGKRPTTSPIPVQRVDSVTDGQSFADDHYRRATDLVGSTTGGLERVRDSIVPRAEAGKGDRSSGSTRLDLNEKFIPFRPGESRAASTAIDNPFSEKRSIASITDIPSSAAGKPSTGGSSLSGTGGGIIGSASAEGSALANGSKGGSVAGAPARGGRGAVRTNGASSSAASTSSVSRTTASLQDGARKTGHESTRDILDGLFKLPYREIETRLNRIEVAEALIGAKISVQDAKGRVLGSRKAKERYVFSGFDKPLLRMKD